MPSFTLTTTPGAAYVGTEDDDTFLVPSYAAWLAAGRTIDGRGGTDTLVFQYKPTLPAELNVVDAEFAGISNLEALSWEPGPGGGSILTFNGLGSQASASFAGGILYSGQANFGGAGLTVPVNAQVTLGSLSTGSADDVVFTSSFFSAAQTGAGNDRITISNIYNSVFGNPSPPFSYPGTVDGGPGYDIVIGLGAPTNGAVSATAQVGGVVNIEEIWPDARFNLLVTTSTSLTGLDGNGARLPLVLRMNTTPLNIYASDDGRPSYDGRIIAYGGAGNDTVRGSSVADLLDGGSGGADSLSGEGGDDQLVFQNVAHAAGAAQIAGGAGYDILMLKDPGQLVGNPVFSRATGFEEFRADGRIELLSNLPSAFTGLDGLGARNPLVLRPSTGSFSVIASEDGRAAYDGRILAYGGAGDDTIRGSSQGDWLDAGVGGVDSLLGAAGNDILLFQNAEHAAGATAIGGDAGYDILALRAAGLITDDNAFARASGLEEFYLLGSGSQTVNLGANSDAAFAASNFGAGSVSAPYAQAFTLNAASTNRALSIYGTGVETIRAGNGNDFIEMDGIGADRVFAGGGADHVRFASALGAGGEYDGGAGYDVVMAGTQAAATLSAPPANPSVFRGFEEMRLIGGGAINLSLSGLSVFGGGETGYGTLQAPNAASLTLNLSAMTIGVSVRGTAGADVFTATATASDYLVGGAGGDTFRFVGSCGVDVVADLVSGTDKIALVGFSGITDFAAVQARTSFASGNATIALSPIDAVILAGVSSLSAGDFLFT